MTYFQRCDSHSIRRQLVAFLIISGVRIAIRKWVVLYAIFRDLDYPGVNNVIQLGCSLPSIPVMRPMMSSLGAERCLSYELLI